MTMKLTRLYTGADGETHFEDVEVPLADSGRLTRTSEIEKAAEIVFRETSGDYSVDWHNVPRRQYVIMLKGEVEIEIGDGTKRRFGPGDVFLAEDTTGRGHISRAVNNQPRTSIFVRLE